MNKDAQLKLIQNAKELYNNPLFKGIEQSLEFSNRFLLFYTIEGYSRKKLIFTIDFKPNSNCVTILDWYRAIWSKEIRDSLITYFKLLGFEVR